MVRRIFIVWARPIFHEALSAILQHPDIQIVGASSSHAESEEAIRQLQPDTIILEETEEAPITSMDMSRLLETTASARRVIRVSMEDNILWMVRRNERIMHQADELLNLIQEE